MENVRNLSQEEWQKASRVSAALKGSLERGLAGWLAAVGTQKAKISPTKGGQRTLLLLLFASTKFCDFGIPTILRVLNFAISRSRAKFCDSRNQR